MAIALTQKRASRSSMTTGEGAVLREKAPNREWRMSRKVKTREVLFFTNQLSLMLEIGSPLNQSLSAIADQMENPELKSVVTAILGEVEDGAMLSQALKRYPELFSPEYTSLVSAGENTGHLSEMLDRVVELQEKRDEFVSALKGAMTYPLVLCIITTVVIVFMLSFVFPRFAIIFQEVEQILPPTTRFLMALSHLLRTYWFLLLLVLAAFWWGLRLFFKTERGRSTIDWLKISLPLLADIMIKVYLSQVMRTLGFLMGSSVPLMEALQITRSGIVNIHFSRFLDKLIDNVESGSGITPAFRETDFIPATVTQMVATGEEAQRVDRVLLRLSDHYETEIKAQIKKTTTIIEPLLLIFMGVVVGLIVVSLILPIFKISKVVH